MSCKHESGNDPCSRDKYKNCVVGLRQASQRWQHAHPERAIQKDLNWRKSNPKGAMNKDRRAQLARCCFTESLYEQRLREQRSKCAICKRAKKDCGTGKGKGLVPDHNHATNKPRGLLCSACNKALGFFGDDVESLQAAIKYLKHWKS